MKDEGSWGIPKGLEGGGGGGGGLKAKEIPEGRRAEWLD